MRRRKWWSFIALSLVLLAACVGVWKWSERPPFAFMKGSQLWFVEARSPGKYAVYYTTAAPEERFAPDGDLSPWGHPDPIPADVTVGIMPAGDRDGFPPMAPGTNTIILLTRPPTILDRFHGWLYGLRWKGMNR